MTSGKHARAAKCPARRGAPRPVPTAGRLAAHRNVLLALLLFAVTFTALEVRSYSIRSATWDESVHLTAGYLALTRGDYRFDLTHPPLLRMWAALPLTLMEVTPPDTAAIDRSTPTQWLAHGYAAAHEFVYLRNDADRLLDAARFMVVLLGIALGVVLFAWVYEWLGFVPALMALAFYTLEPNLLAHASLVTTDFGTTLFIFGGCYFLWRVCRTPTSAASMTGLAVCVALAIVSKSSALLLGAMVVPLLVLAVACGMVSWRRALGIVGLLLAASIATVWAVYGFRYAPSAAPNWVFRTQDLPVVRAHTPGLAALIGWIDAHHLLPNAFTQGFLYGQSSVEDLPGYLAGESKRGGWWYYFPVAFVLKSPIALVVLLATGLAVLGRRWRDWSNAAFVLIPPGVFLGFAMVSGINIGVRHILPVYPFAIVVCALGASALMAARQPLVRAAAAGLAGLWLVMFVRVYPNTLTFFSLLVGGPGNGGQYLVDSNLDWGQHLKQLAGWMKERGVSHINLAYFGTADPAYYKIDCTYLPGSPPFLAGTLEPPTLPGYVAISETVLAGVYASPAWRLFYSGFRNIEPVADIGHSMRVYWLDRWPEASPRPEDDEDWKAERSLADALLFQQGWYDHAIVHYRRYLAERPDDGDAGGNLSVALLQSGRPDEALAVLREATTRTPDSAALHRLLAAALCEHGSAADAEAEARKSLALEPHDPVTHDLLGRALAIQERWREARDAFSRALAIAPGFDEAREHLRWLAQSGR